MNQLMETCDDESCRRHIRQSPQGSDQGVLSAVGRHLGLVLLVTAAWCLAAGIYLTFATRAYTSRAKLSIEPAGPRVLSGDDRQLARSPGYVAQQCDVILSAPVLRDAVAGLVPDDRACLAGASDPVELLKRDLDVSAGKKDDVITISLESPDPRLAARVVGNVVTAYLAHRAGQQQAASREVLRILRKEMALREEELAAAQNALVEFGRQSGLALVSEKTDMATQQLSRLFQALTEAHLATITARTNQEAVEALANDPGKLRLLAESLGLFDRQVLSDIYQPQLVVERGRMEVELASLRQELTDEHPSVQGLKARLAIIVSEQARQARDLTERCVDMAHQQHQAAQSREAGIRQSIQQQQQIGQQSGADFARYTLLQAKVHQAERFCDVVKGRIMETSAAQEAGAMDVRIIEPVYTGPLATRPKTAASLASAGGAGLMLGALLALFRDRRRRRRDEVLSRGTRRVRTIGRIPLVSTESDRRGLVHCASLWPTSDLAGAYRSVAAELHFRCRGARSLMLTSSKGAVGTTTLACNLAQILAQSGKRTLLVDAAFDHPSLHEVFGVDGQRGLADVLRGTASLRKAVAPTSVEGLHLLPAGLNCAAMAKDLAGKPMRGAIRSLSRSYDVVLIDAPPVACRTQPAAMASCCDGTILVATARQIDSGAIGDAALWLQRFGATVVGVVSSPAPDCPKAEVSQKRADIQRPAAARRVDRGAL
jgi:capsular exopolysaccharide synthesis family protein